MKINQNAKFIVAGIFFLIFMMDVKACWVEKKSSEDSSKIKIVIKSKSPIDEVIFSKIGTIENNDFKDWEDTLVYTSDEFWDDCYQLITMSKGKIISRNDFWLQGNDILIKAELSEKLDFDTVYNCPFYYQTNDLLFKVREMMKDSLSASIVDSLLLSGILEFFDHPFSNELTSLYRIQNSKDTKKIFDLVQLVSGQNEIVKSHLTSIHEKLRQSLKLNSRKITEFQLSDQNLEKVDIEDHLRSLNLIDIWFTSCPPCLKDHQKIKEKLTLLNEASIQVIGISVDMKDQKWQQYLKEHPLPWPQWIANGPNSNFSTFVFSYPTYLIVNQTGEITEQFENLEEAFNYLTTLTAKK